MDSVHELFVPAAALAAVCLFVLSSGAAVAGEPGSPRAAGQVGAPIPWTACDPPNEGLQCARIRVPLDWDRPKGRTISLALIRNLASKPDEGSARRSSILAAPATPASGC